MFIPVLHFSSQNCCVPQGSGCNYLRDGPISQQLQWSLAYSLYLSVFVDPLSYIIFIYI